MPRFVLSALQLSETQSCSGFWVPEMSTPSQRTRGGGGGRKRSEGGVPSTPSTTAPARGRPPGPGRNIDINQRITKSADASELCTIIETRAAEFNHVNVATAFRKLLPLQGRHDVASRG